MKREAAEVRFWKYANQSNGCWLWTGCICQGTGYPLIRESVTNKPLGAHRMSWRLHYGPIPKGQSVLHKCDVRHCVNPDHLFLGTQRDNVLDMVSKNRQAKGEENGNRKLNQAQVDEIRRRYASKKHQRDHPYYYELAAEYGVHIDTIVKVVNGKLWRHSYSKHLLKADASAHEIP